MSNRENPLRYGDWDGLTNVAEASEAAQQQQVSEKRPMLSHHSLTLQNVQDGIFVTQPWPQPIYVTSLESGMLRTSALYGVWAALEMLLMWPPPEGWWGSGVVGWGSAVVLSLDLN